MTDVQVGLGENVCVDGHTDAAAETDTCCGGREVALRVLLWVAGEGVFGGWWGGHFGGLVRLLDSKRFLGKRVVYFNGYGFLAFPETYWVDVV